MRNIVSVAVSSVCMFKNEVRKNGRKKNEIPLISVLFWCVLESTDKNYLVIQCVAYTAYSHDYGQVQPNERVRMAGVSFCTGAIMISYPLPPIHREHTCQNPVKQIDKCRELSVCNVPYVCLYIRKAARNSKHAHFQDGEHIKQCRCRFWSIIVGIPCQLYCCAP